MPKSKPLPPLEVVKRKYAYDPETGVWTCCKSGRTAGYTNPRGYTLIRCNYSKYLAHRLAWLWMTGTDPGKLEVDHIDGNPNNNRWTNLRLASRGGNCYNTRLRSDSSAGFKGVHFDKKRRKYVARICKEGNRVMLGCFNTAYEAHLAYTATALALYGAYACAAARTRAVV